MTVNCPICKREIIATKDNILFTGKGLHAEIECTHCMSPAKKKKRDTLVSTPKAGKRDGLVGANGKGNFRSAWEANYARLLQYKQELAEIKAWEFEPVVFKFPVKKGTVSYTPDFRVTKLDDSQYYVEVKGYMTQKGRTQLRRMRKYYPEEWLKLEIINSREYKALDKFWSRIIEGWE